MLQAIVGGIRDLIFPSLCAWCREPCADDVSFCPKCTTEILTDGHYTCPKCLTNVSPLAHVADGCSMCEKDTFHYDHASRLNYYDGTIRDIILQMKQQQGLVLAYSLGVLWGRHFQERFAQYQFDAIVPVPLHWTRRWVRLYNQSAELAGGIAQVLNLPVLNNALLRVKRTPRQTQSSPTARRENMRGAFRASRRVNLDGKRILLVDDVLTTGSTASEAAKALRQVGASFIHVAVVAHR
ncbi:MAG: ComF family protein [Zavarzinella sp.]